MAATTLEGVELPPPIHGPDPRDGACYCPTGRTQVAGAGPVCPEPTGTPLWTDDHLEVFVQGSWGIRVPGMRWRALEATWDPETKTTTVTGPPAPKVPTCPGHVTPWSAFCSAFRGRSPVEVWKGSRGFSGKTWLLALLTLTEAAALGADSTILGGSGEQSQRVHEAADTYWSHPEAPRDLLLTDPTRRETRLATGAIIRALLASTRSARGPHPQRLRMDEVDEVDVRILDAALGQPMSKVRLWGLVKASTVLSSTHQYADGTMTEVLRRAADKGWPVRQWCYRECLEPHGWLAEAEVLAKRETVTAAMWESEYELQDPDPGDRAIDIDAVKAMFRRELGELLHHDWQYREFEAPAAGARYATGADWGRSVDYTVIPTMRTDVRPWKLVAWERGRRRPWPFMIGRLAERLKRYPGPAAHDATGIGDVIAQHIPQRGSLPPIEDFVFKGADRDELLNAYILVVEHRQVVAPFVHVAEAEHRLASRRTVFGEGHLPDTIAAMALCRRAAGVVPTGMPTGIAGAGYWRGGGGL